MELKVAFNFVALTDLQLCQLDGLKLIETYLSLPPAGIKGTTTLPFELLIFLPQPSVLGL